MRERLALLLLGVGVDDHHQLVRLVDAAEQQVVDGVERLLAALGGDRREVAAARTRGQNGLSSSTTRAPVVARAEDAAVRRASRSRGAGSRRSAASSAGSAASAHGGSAA